MNTKLYNWTLTAFKELVTNAVLHKEYNNSQYIGIYKDRISFINPNRPLHPIIIDMLNNSRSFE